MKSLLKPLALATLCVCAALCLLATHALATWPTTLEENLAIANNPSLWEGYPVALPYSNDRTLVIFSDEGLGNVYQIIDRFGNFAFPSPQGLAPTSTALAPWNTEAIPDCCGGAFAVWRNYPGLPYQNQTYAQRLDSLGNRLWGDSAVIIFPECASANQFFDICPDGNGGFFFTLAYSSKIWVQHVSSLGQGIWGDSGVVICDAPNAQTYPLLTPDNEGGAFVVWRDQRPPYYPYGAVFMQRVNANGVPLWATNGEYLCGSVWFQQIIPDGQNGFILHNNADLNWYNKVFRVGPDGNVLWTRDHVSWFEGAKMVAGEPGYFYLAFNYHEVFYGQRMNMQGNIFWPTWGSGQVGALIAIIPGWGTGGINIGYRYPYLHSLYSFIQRPGGTAVEHLLVQSLDSLGARQFGANGTELTYQAGSLWWHYFYLNPIPDAPGGLAAIWEYQNGNSHDVYAKHINADGSLGGPFPLVVTLSPHNPPIQIPPQGGSFSYDLAIADTTPVGGLIDAWIQVTLPNSSTLEILSRNNLTITPGGVLSRNNVVQTVPSAAPPGMYAYTLYAGDHDHNSPWGQDNFTFEKLPGRTPLRAHDSCWALSGLEASSIGARRVEDPLAAATKSGSGATPTMEVMPNPFNPTTAISFELRDASYVNLKVYDTSGRLVATLVDGWREAGQQEGMFDGSRLASGIYICRLTAGDFGAAQKLVLLK